jgi:hypothetical protein
MESNLQELKQIENNPILYPKHSKVRKLMHKVKSLQCELGEVYEEEVVKYRYLFPNLDTNTMLKQNSSFPWKGLLTGVAISVLNIGMSNYRSFEATGTVSSIFKAKNLASRGGRVMLLNLGLVTASIGIDYFYINSFSGMEMNHLYFLEWCKAYRTGKCLLEFSTDKKVYQEVKYNDMSARVMNNVNPIDHYQKMLDMVSESAANPEEEFEY